MWQFNRRKSNKSLIAHIRGKRATQVAQWWRNCLPMQETQKTRVWSLSWEDLEEEIASHSSILAWKILWTRSLSGYSPWGRKRSDITEWLSSHIQYMHGRDPGKLGNSLKPWSPRLSLSSSAKDKRERWWWGLQRGRRQFRQRLKSQCLVNKCLLGPA